MTGRSRILFTALLLATSVAAAKPPAVRHEWAPAETGEVDAVGSGSGTLPSPSKAANDTVWIADWTFDAAGGGCDDTGWTKIDNRIFNNGSNYWHIGPGYDGQGGISGQAAILSKHDPCWVSPDGYGNSWDYSIILKYQGPGARLSFDFSSDSEPGYDFFTVEADSGGASESRVSYERDPAASSTARFRRELLSFSGPQFACSVDSLELPTFSAPTIGHEVYIRFASDGGYSDEDGLYPSSLHAGCVIDNIEVTGALVYTEDFEGVLNASVSLTNTAFAQPFGEWARLYRHITDNDKCNENATCAWLWTDSLRVSPWPHLGFAPGGAILHPYLDNSILSPWVSLATTPTAVGTVLTFRRFGGSWFHEYPIVQNWSVRSSTRTDNTDSAAPGDSLDCVKTWAHAANWNALSSFVWATYAWDMTSYLEPAATSIQLRLRVTDWHYIACEPPSFVGPGPGPFIDRVRIGRRVLSGPVWNVGIDTRTQPQDCFPTMQNGIVPGEHFDPETDTSAPLYPYLFGSCAFSIGTELTINAAGPNLVTGDSIYASVLDARGAGGITDVKWYGAIVAGPHAGKSPVAPYTVGANGFFEVTADSARSASGAWVAGHWFVDLDDTYFRGGDQLVYFWYAADAAGGGGSLPKGIDASSFPPPSVAAAEAATDGLFEVSFLPTIDWAAAYVERLAADAHGDLDPTAAEVAGSEPRNRLLYYQHTNSGRRSGPTQRTSFMYALDRLGYAGHYDVYDVQGYGNTNNQLGGRATVAQASVYALLVEDDGRSYLSPNVPDGRHPDGAKIDQAQWYRDYLAQALTSRAKTASLWLLGESTAYESSTNPLFTSDFGLASVLASQGPQSNPDVLGVGSFTTWDGRTTDWVGDLFALAGGCPTPRNYDAAAATGTAVVTHRYRSGPTLGGGAIIMNRNAALHWNTVWMGFGLFDVRLAIGEPPTIPPDVALVDHVLACLLPAAWRQTPVVTDAGGDATAALPRVTALHQNVPNPFNPTTTIRFDLAREGHVELHVYDVAGHRVKTLVNGTLTAGWNIAIPWTGLDDAGSRVPSGVYFYRLETDDLTATKKMLLMK